MKIEVLVNATMSGKDVWGAPNGLAARAYGLSRCINWRIGMNVLFTAIRFVDEDGIPL